MSSAESMRPDRPEEPRLPRSDIRLSREHRDQLHVALANVFNSQRSVEEVLRPIGFPPGRIPVIDTPMEAWSDILLELENGIIQAGFYQLLSAALRPYPHHEIFRSLAEAYGIVESEEGSGGPRDEQAGAAPEREAATCHVIVRASSEEDRERTASALREFGLDPVEQWSTAHAISYRVNSSDPEQVRQRLRRTAFGWTVVAPGLRDYLLHTLYIEGPDGRQFRITDAPAQQTVGNVAAEVIDQYGGRFPDANRPPVVDHVGTGGEGRRLGLDSTLDESGVRDRDRLRVGFQVRAAAVNPLDRQDALYRVRNQIQSFAETRLEAGFVVRANSTVLPTEYELEFRQPSFGPPAAPDTPPLDIDLHRVLIQLGPDFPESPPLVFWTTPIYHPNVFPTYECEVARGREQQMGLVCLGALQESYLPSLDFGTLCQLLMDIAGFRNYSLYVPDGSIDTHGRQRERADFFDPYAAAWARSEEGQRRIRQIKGSAARQASPIRPEYHNVIEKIGDE